MLTASSNILPSVPLSSLLSTIPAVRGTAGKAGPIMSPVHCIIMLYQLWRLYKS
jgi:hypothetical protein